VVTGITSFWWNFGNLRREKIICPKVSMSMLPKRPQPKKHGCNVMIVLLESMYESFQCTVIGGVQRWQEKKPVGTEVSCIQKY
jgi:hypothetical protein